MRVQWHYRKFKLDYDFYWITKRNLHSSIAYSLLLTLLGIVLLTAYGMLTSQLKFSESIELPWLFYYLFISVPAQEFIFRGIVFTEIAKIMDLNIALILAAGVYAAAFVTQPNLILFAFFTGTAWNYLMYEKPNIIGPIISHQILGVYFFTFIA